jgi:hypothetical protein
MKTLIAINAITAGHASTREELDEFIRRQE